MLTPVPRKKSVRKGVSVKQEIKGEPQESSIPSLPLDALNDHDYSDYTATTSISGLLGSVPPPQVPKQPTGKEPSQQVNRIIHTRKQKEQDGQPLFEGIDE
jgi:hypothetical protein